MKGVDEAVDDLIRHMTDEQLLCLLDVDVLLDQQILARRPTRHRIDDQVIVDENCRDLLIGVRFLGS